MKSNYPIIIAFVLLQGYLAMVPHLFAGSIPGGRSPDEPRANNDPVVIDTLDLFLMEPANGVQFYKDDIILFSNSKYRQKMLPDHISFGRFGTFLVNPDSPNASRNRTFVEDNLFPVMPEEMSFTGDYRILYYSAAGRDERTASTRKIFMIPVEEDRSSGQLRLNPSDIETLPFCTGFNNYMHPAAAPDNSFLVYASDSRSSLGGYDLYLVRYSGNKWSDPVNLGKEINTKQDELYPFIDSDFNLYFSSGGHSGFGGLDIYMCRYQGDGWSKPVNLMEPINTRHDEAAITFDRSGRSGYFSVINRPGGLDSRLFRMHSEGSEKLSGVLFLSAQERYSSLSGDLLTGAGDEPVTVIGIPSGENEKKEFPAETTVTAKVTEEKKEKAAETETVKAIPVRKAEEVSTARQAAEPTPVKQEQVTPPVARTETTPAEPEADKEAVVFRVQIVSSSKPKTNYRVNIDGRIYPAFEYYYKGAYRYTVGAFSSAGEADAFKNRCRKAGYSQAFVAAFINDERVTDPSVFKQ
ncbi:MAG: PD40 domain-containing protein [Bacteroidales bacterium]|nr:PD40 domain-containing protein [Bacteroidales bacterium]MBN2699614.1 PD40 domain-containing protein [Bacteroidales bacterium]